MHKTDLDTERKSGRPTVEVDLVLDIEAEMVTLDVVDSGSEVPAGRAPEGGVTVDEPESRVARSEPDDLMDELVGLVNARDLDGLSAVLAPDVIAEFLDSTSRFGFIAGMSELVLRNPTLMVTRGHLDSEPIAALWMLQQGKDAPCLVGYLTFEIGDTGELIQRLDYVEELPGLEDLIIEMPETLDLPEWEVWPSDER